MPQKGLIWAAKNALLMPMDESNMLEAARTCLLGEAAALQAVQDRLGESFLKAASIILAKGGKVVVIGIGKSGHIGEKIAATLCSTGTPAVFLHAAEALHGDLGVYAPGDPTILISNSGSTAELVRLTPTLKDFESPIIGILGNMDSPLARECDAVLDASVAAESDPLGIAPTASTVAALAWGDALASALMSAKNFQKADFARFHPAGQLGRNLLLRVQDAMQKAEAVAFVSPDEDLRNVVIAMTERPQGGACVVDADGNLLGIITDGDLRRAFKEYEDIRTLKAEAAMTKDPVFVQPQERLADAIERMEGGKSQISVLPVVAKDGRKCLGLLRLHDIYKPNA